jgi:hypothetical protein
MLNELGPLDYGCEGEDGNMFLQNFPTPRSIWKSVKAKVECREKVESLMGESLIADREEKDHFCEICKEI